MHFFKSKTACNDRAYFYPRTALLLLTQRAGTEGMCLIGLGGQQVGDLVHHNAREVDANVDDLTTYCRALIKRADKLLWRKHLREEQVLQLAASLMALHGPASQTMAMIEQAREQAPFVTIDVANRRVGLSRFPVGAVLDWAGSELMRVH